MFEETLNRRSTVARNSNGKITNSFTKTESRLKGNCKRLVKVFRSHRPPILLAITYWAAVAIVFLIVTNYVFRWIMPIDDSAVVPPEAVVSMSLTAVAGAGGLMFFVTTHRRQKDLEEGRFIERFGAAAEQLGHADVAVRMAGVYAMAGAADQSRDFEQRQQCIDVLCGYMRLPFNLNLIEEHQTMKIISTSENQPKSLRQEIHYQYRQNDSEVRKTIVRIIAAHLRPTDLQSWSLHSFDFTGANFESANFAHTEFHGSNVIFNYVNFNGNETSFQGATFGGKETWFENALFNQGRTSFRNARFNGRMVSFEKAAFSGEVISFRGAVFNDVVAWFKGVEFTGGRASFRGTTFNGGLASFEGANYSGETDFSSPVFWGPTPFFDWDDRSSGVSKPPNVRPDEWPPSATELIDSEV